jgi:hypothetical protein
MPSSLGLMSFVLDNSVVSGWILNATRDQALANAAVVAGVGVVEADR